MYWWYMGHSMQHRLGQQRCSGGLSATGISNKWYNKCAMHETTVDYCPLFCSVAAIPLLTTRSGSGTGTALLNNFACTGQELSLLDCRHSQSSHYSCHYTAFVGVQCLGKNNIAVSLGEYYVDKILMMNHRSSKCNCIMS